MAGYIGTKAALLSTTTASVGGDSTVGGDLTVDTNTLYVDSANNRVGIGTISPSTILTLKRDSAGTSESEYPLLSLDNGNANGFSQLRFADDGSEIASIFSNSADKYLVFRAGGATERMRIDASGRVTMPYQPAFMAFSNTYTASGEYPFVSFSLGYTGAFNRGNHFNLSTGVFTAPVAGAYQINYIFHDTANSAKRHIGRIFVNGGAISWGEVAEGYDTFSDIGGGVVLNLSANDNVTWNTHPFTWGAVTASAFLIG